MSLLMKALEKAAKDRGEARAEPAATPAGSRPELTLALELLAADTPSPRLREDTRSEATARHEAPASGYYRDEAARAAALMQAGDSGDRGWGGYLRDHPIVVFGALAGLFALGFGAYVYLQIFYPGVFIRSTPAPAPPPRVVETAPAAPAGPQPVPTASVVASSTDPAPQQSTSALPLQLAASPSAAEPPDQPVPPAPPPAKPVAVRPAEKPEATPGSSIVVKRGEAAAAVNPLLAEAYAALQDERLDRAGQLYSKLLRSEPKNSDALLGLAAIAVREGRSEDAVNYYRAILEVDPGHALAQSGLTGLTGRADPLAAESRLKELIAREPSAYAYFTLGNLYADQSLWAQAQQAYFQAHRLEPDNPDYAYNLAVGLEHLSQPRLAAGFYRRALELAASRGHVNFDPARARERIAALASRLE